MVLGRDVWLGYNLKRNQGWYSCVSKKPFNWKVPMVRVMFPLNNRDLGSINLRKLLLYTPFLEGHGVLLLMKHFLKALQ